MRNIEFAKRLNGLPFYLYPTIDEAVAKARQKGLDIIDLSIGEAGFPTPVYIVEALRDSCAIPEAQRYGKLQGYPPFRASIADWYARRFGVELDGDKEVITFLGSKEGIAFLPLGVTNPGDLVLVPDPGYPTYRYAATFAGAEVMPYRLRPENNFVPDFDDIPKSIAERAKLIFLNYPNNPTAATVDKAFFDRVVDFARRYNILVCHDAAYTEVVYDGYKAPSFMEAKGAKEVGIEFNTLSKTYCMTGWRIGFAVGHSEIVKALLEVKRVTSTGHFTALEIAGMRAIEEDPVEVERNNRVLERNRNFVVSKLKSFGISIEPPKGSFYVWFPIANKGPSLDFVINLIIETGVVIFPGIGYGENGEGYARISFAPKLSDLEKALSRIRSYF